MTCLQNAPQRTADIREAGIRFLLAQKSERWSFNYWARGAHERITLPYPDDCDDTFAALAAIARHNNALIDGHALSAVAKILTGREVQEGGPYRTWLVPDDARTAWQDVDPVVNSTIGYFLSLVGVRLPQLQKFLEDAACKGQLSSPYYPGIFPAVYFLSRFYKSCGIAGMANATRAALADIITRRLRRNGHDSGLTTLERAMAISSLVALGQTKNFPLDAATDLLVAQLEREGFLPCAFCIDPARDGKRCYAGASALTAAFCAEALTLAPSHRAISNGAGSATSTPIPTIHNHIRGLARTACRSLDSDLRTMAITQIERTTDEKITMLAYEFHEALYKKGTFIPPDLIESLSLANLFGWMAYDIYDDALDGEDGAALIPCANFFLRALTETYHSLGARAAGIAPLFKNTMDRIDNANAWEQRHCRIPAAEPLPSFGDHQTLADRSIGHALGPLAMLLLAGYDANGKEYKNVESFFRHYLIARQLHDDAHDWAEDLLRGRVTSVGVIVLNNFKEKYSDAALPQLKKIFWEETIDVVARTIIAHVDAARRARESSPLSDTDFMESALQRLASGARRAIAERNEALVFLKDYKGFRPTGARA